MEHNKSDGRSFSTFNAAADVVVQELWQKVGGEEKWEKENMLHAGAELLWQRVCVHTEERET